MDELEKNLHQSCVKLLQDLLEENRKLKLRRAERRLIENPTAGLNRNRKFYLN
jgi:hypothetical protein